MQSPPSSRFPLAEAPSLPPGPDSPPRRNGIVRRAAAFAGRLFDALLGFAAMTLTLAVVSAVPLLNLLSLGFLLEASARVAKSGRFRDGFVGLAVFARLGKVALGVWLWTLPLRLVSHFWRDAELISAGSRNANGLRVLLALLIVLVVMHLVAACLRGGKLRHFLLPAPWQWIRWMSGREPLPRLTLLPGIAAASKRILRFARLGFGGFLGAALWLVVPLGLLLLSSGADRQGIAFLGSLLGGLLLGTVVLFLPFLQTRYAVSHRFRDFLAVSEIRNLFRRAPLAFCLALTATLLFALPLYLLKIELTPAEVAWLPNLIFVLFIIPARILLGWALARAGKAEADRAWPSRWISGLVAVPVVAGYVTVVWFSQYVSWHGTWSLLEQHAFLVPAPLFGL